MQDYSMVHSTDKEANVYGNGRGKERGKERERERYEGRKRDEGPTGQRRGSQTHTLDTRNDSISHRSACSQSQWSTARADICFRALSAAFCWRVVWIFARTDIGTNISEHRARRWIWYDKPMCGMAAPVRTHTSIHISVYRVFVLFSLLPTLYRGEYTHPPSPLFHPFRFSAYPHRSPYFYFSLFVLSSVIFLSPFLFLFQRAFVVELMVEAFGCFFFEGFCPTSCTSLMAVFFHKDVSMVSIGGIYTTSAFVLVFPQTRYLIFNRSILHQIFIPVSWKLLCPLDERVSPRCLLHPGSKSFPPENDSILAGWISCGIFSKPIREHQARGRGEAVVQFGSSKLRS